MDTGELLIRWTARLALILYAMSLLLRWSAAGRRSRLAAARLAWSGGALLLLLHVGCSLQIEHHGSQADAYETIARRTAEVVGWRWGGGLYVNYVFALAWLADAAWWWRGLEAYESRSRLIAWSVRSFLAFIVFNAAVVFAAGMLRWLSLAACVLLVIFRVWMAAFLRSLHLPPSKELPDEIAS